ncbi:MAG: histidine kinase N-terminal 7TM domain-containing protein [Firmicutes bacterium]|nr:histidine kinase N-terminal 7TM domain-containing protein [Bacillota bacterium]
MISSTELFLLLVLIVFFVSFLVYSMASKRRMRLVQKLYDAFCAVILVWMLSLVGMRFTNPENQVGMYIWDSLTYIGVAFAPMFMLQIALAFVSGRERMPKRWMFLYIVPVITNLVVWTNPLHHLHYRVFSVIRSELTFGPYILISGAYTYLCLIAGMVVLLRVFRQSSRFHKMQILLLMAGQLVPLTVSICATFLTTGMSIAATPISFSVTLVCNYFAIYRLHLLDVVPIATQKVLDLISDGYLMLSENGLVIDTNLPFRETFGKLYGVSTNRNIRECTACEENNSKNALNYLIASLHACAESGAPMAYEQSVIMQTKDGSATEKRYYMVEITPLEINRQFSGHVVIFKDVTQIKKSMQQLQDGQARLMEQERLALLGQMVGGLAHNLKTPIMSISGCASSIEQLVREAEESQGDPEVTPEDYGEIYDEMASWLDKIRQSCTYMSDIITAIKGQAANVSTSDEREFTLDELIKRVTLLMRHELLVSGCKLIQEQERCPRVTLRGDINNIVQVLNNLIGNAIDAERDSEKKDIYIGMKQNKDELSIYIRDTGRGIPPRVRERLFQEMVTTKGTKGTGLGLFISNSVIRGKFGGSMWAEDAPGGGTIIGFTIPVANTMTGKEGSL